MLLGHTQRMLDVLIDHTPCARNNVFVFASLALSSHWCVIKVRLIDRKFLAHKPTQLKAA